MSDTPPVSERHPESEPQTAPAAEEILSSVEEAQAEAAKFKDLYLRSLADLDNLRKRNAREIESARLATKGDVVRELLPVFDNITRGIQSAERATDVQSLTEGLGMILRQFEGTLEKIGIQRVPGIGSAFDPQVHEAISQIETDEHPAGTVVDEVQAGYTSGERLVRAAMVVVAKAKSAGVEA